jgi:DNA replication protein DnaC
VAGGTIEIHHDLQVVAEHRLAEGHGAMALDSPHYAGLNQRRVDRRPIRVQPMATAELAPGPGVGQNFVPPEVEQRSLAVYEEVPMSLQSERLELLMQRLSLPDMAQGYAALAGQAAQKNLSYFDFLEQILESEFHARQERNTKVRTQLAGFPGQKRLEQFDFKFPASIDEKKIRELASLRFPERHENVVFLGPPGVGKTHLAVSLGMEAIRQGFSVYFVSLPELLDRLLQAQAENRMRRKMTHLRKCRLLILDEIGYRMLDRQATTCLFQLISERYERSSMILTSNNSSAQA